MKPLTREQIAQLSATLAPFGLVVKTAPKPRSTGRLAEIRAWRPETPAGRACKSNMLWLASLPPVTGVGQVRYGRFAPYKEPANIARYYDGKWSEIVPEHPKLLTCNKRRAYARAKLCT